MIKWLSKFPLLKEIYRQGGIDSFALAQRDILETMRDDLEKQAEELSKVKLAQLLSPVDLNQIVKYDKTGRLIYIGSETADEGRLGNLKSEAEMIFATNLWKLLTETPKELAQRAMFIAGDSIHDMTKGRAILYTISTQENILNTFKNLSPNKK